MTVLLAVLAAAVYGVAVALQHHEAAAVDPARSLSPRLLAGVLVRDIGGFALQTAALALGSVLLVQPILTLSLVVSLLLGSRFSRQPLPAWQWLTVGGVVAGLATFLTVARPTGHSDAVASATAWMVALGAVATVSGVALVVGKATDGTGRAACFALAAACAEAVMAVLAKAFGDRLGHGVWSTFGSWQPYAVAACGVLTMVLVQSAYQVGRATVTLPVLTVAEPLVAITLGAALFGEHLHVAGWSAAAAVVAVAVMGVSLAAIASASRVTDTDS
jgi:drug/metabolite transporter (DMT)-like permease